MLQGALPVKDPASTGEKKILPNAKATLPAVEWQNAQKGVRKFGAFKACLQ